jgi:hypothetical protein
MDITRLLPALALAFFSTVSQADTQVQTFDIYAPVGAGSNGSGQVDPYFDSALGTLIAVDLEVHGTSQLTSNFKDTCGLDSNGDCFIRGDFSITLLGSLHDPLINSLLVTDAFWIFDPVTDDPVLYNGMTQSTNYPDTAWAQFYTSGDSSTINWYSWFRDENASPEGSASNSGEVNITLTFTYTYDPIDTGPTVDLIFSGTTGTGTTGSNTIRAKAGDVLTLDIVVTDNDGLGICAALLSLYWGAGILTGSNAESCPSPPNAVADTCNDSTGVTYFASGPVSQAAGSAENFVTAVDCIGGTTPGFVGESMTLGRTQLLVVTKTTSDIVVGYLPGQGILDGTVSTIYEPAATATVLPPAGC